MPVSGATPPTGQQDAGRRTRQCEMVLAQDSDAAVWVFVKKGGLYVGALLRRPRAVLAPIPRRQRRRSRVPGFQLPEPSRGGALVALAVVFVTGAPCCACAGVGLLLSAVSKRCRARRVLARFRCDAPDGAAGRGAKDAAV